MTDIQWMLAVAVYVVVGFAVYLIELYMDPVYPGSVEVGQEIFWYIFLWPLFVFFWIFIALGDVFLSLTEKINDAGYRRKYGNRTDA